MSIQEQRNVNETNSLVRSYIVDISREEAKRGRNYFRLPNGKKYYIDSDTDEVYLAKNQD